MFGTKTRQWVAGGGERIQPTSISHSFWSSLLEDVYPLASRARSQPLVLQPQVQRPPVGTARGQGSAADGDAVTQWSRTTASLAKIL